MHQPFKGMILAAPEGALNSLPTALLPRAAAKAAVCVLCLGILATRKRVYIFLETDLIFRDVFLKLIAYIFFYTFLILPDCIYVVSPAPKMPVPIFVFQIRVPVEYHQGTFSLQIPYKLRYAEVRWDTHEHMDMIRARFRLYDLHAFCLA